MRELAVDKGMRRFRNEYERLYQALVKAHEGHRLLAERCRLLTEQSIENSGKLQTSVQLCQQDQIAVARLKTVPAYNNNNNNKTARSRSVYATFIH
jgi:hypothetical protein